MTTISILLLAVICYKLLYNVVAPLLIRKGNENAGESLAPIELVVVPLAVISWAHGGAVFLQITWLELMMLLLGATAISYLSWVPFIIVYTAKRHRDP